MWPQAEREALVGARVLLVDDNTDLLENTKELIEEVGGAEVTTATTGKQALSVAAGSIDLALVDEGLPDASGTSLISALKARHPLAEMLVITGHATVERLLGAIDAQVDGFLLKPISPPQLLETLRRAWALVLARRDAKRMRENLERRERLLASGEAISNLGCFEAAAEDWPSDVFWSDGMFALTGLVHRNYEVPARQKRRNLVHEGDRERLEGAWNSACVEGLSIDVHYRIVKASGETRHLHLQAEPVPGSTQKPRYVGAIQDETSRLQLEREFQQAQKMEAVGALASGIAHDYNNLLMGIAGCLRLVERAELGSGRAKSFLAEAIAATKRGSALTRKLLDFSRPSQESTTEGVALDPQLRTMVPILTAVQGDRIEIRTDLASDDVAVAGSAGDWEQVIMNLVINARDAMPQGGVIEIATALASDDASWVIISVRDTGTGMDAGTKARIFEPFFTTKPVGRGTGLGLATIFGIVKQTGGSISVESELGQGTTFSIRAPVAVASEESGAIHQRMQNGREDDWSVGTEHVLVVEDDAVVRLSLCSLLEEAGYRTTRAHDATRAAEVLRVGHTIDVVVADVVVPGDIDAFERRLATFSERRPVIHMSGHSASMLESMGRLPDSARPLLRKPFSDATLHRVLRASIEAKGVARRSQENGDGAPSGILLVEDDATSRKALAEILRLEGFDVVVAATCAEATSALRRNRFDVLLTDMNLPDGNGVVLAEQARRQRPSPKVVFLTGGNVEGLPRGEYAFTKPVDVDDLVACLRGELYPSGA